jgi:hypothetical protein
MIVIRNCAPFIIIPLILAKYPRYTLPFLCGLITIHFIKLIWMYTHSKDRKDISGEDGPFMYTYLHQLIGGNNWHAPPPKLFVPFYRILFFYVLIIYIIQSKNKRTVPVFIITFLYTMASLREYDIIDKLFYKTGVLSDDNMAGGNIYFTFIIILLLVYSSHGNFM